jgi:hypothetical protein
MDRNSKTITLFRESVLLTERDSFDVMMMVNFSMQNKMQVTPEVFLYQCAKVTESALKYSYKNLPLYRFFRKLNLKRKLRVKYLLKHLSQSELIKLSNQVYELEGIKIPTEDDLKKKVNPEKMKLPNSTNN